MCPFYSRGHRRVSAHCARSLPAGVERGYEGPMSDRPSSAARFSRERAVTFQLVKHFVLA